MIIRYSSILNLKSNLLSDSFDFGGFIIYLLFVLLLLYLVYVSTKFIAKSYAHVGGKRRIKFIEKSVLGLDKAIYLVQIEGENIYFYADKNTCRVLKKTKALEEDAPVFPEEFVPKSNRFLDIFKSKRLESKNEISNEFKEEEKSDDIMGGLE